MLSSCSFIGRTPTELAGTKSVLGLACMLLISIPSVSAQTVKINSPTSGTIVIPGDVISGNFNVSGFNTGLQTIFVTVPGNLYHSAFGPFSQSTTSYFGSISYTVPLRSLEGQTIAISVVAYGWDASTQTSDQVHLVVDDFDPPANDAFAAAEDIPATSGSLSAANQGATFEPGERVHSGLPGGRSVWWK